MRYMSLTMGATWKLPVEAGLVASLAAWLHMTVPVEVLGSLVVPRSVRVCDASNVDGSRPRSSLLTATHSLSLLPGGIGELFDDPI